MHESSSAVKITSSFTQLMKHMLLQNINTVCLENDWAAGQLAGQASRVSTGAHRYTV
jgi:hypothetical protein